LNNSNYDLTLVRNDGVSITTSLGILASDMTITGGTYNSSNGVATFTNNSGGTFNVSGFLTGYTDIYTTGLTYSNNQITLKQTNNQDYSVIINTMTGLTINGSLSATTYLGLPVDVRVTGGTYNAGTAVFTNNTGGTFSVSGFSTGGGEFSGGTVTGPTIFTNGLSANTFSASTYLGLPLDIHVTGGTYNAGTAVFTNNTGGTFSVSGFSDSTTFTGGTVSGATRFIGGLSANTFSATTYLGLPKDVFVTGGTYNAGTATFTNNTGGTFNVVGFSSGGGEFSGGTVTGATIFTNGLSANTFSASTYLGLPLDVFVTGGTYSNGVINFVNNTGGTFNISGLFTGNTDVFVTGGTYNAGTAVFTNNTGGTFNVVGFSTGGGTFTGGTVTGPTIFTGGLSANTFSASTYFGLPKDVFVTGGTYSNGTAVFRNNTGGTFNVVGLTTPFTGGTVSGNTIFTNGLTANTLSVSSFNGSTNRIVEVNSGGTLSATQEIISAYIVSGSTAANLLENTTNWDINGIYTGTTISNTFMGQKHYNFNYFFEAVDNNLWIRLIRG
jgi:hypothetical protein